ncbi:hypothetical protein GWK47_048465 [Chionoecetes opilio]|uniref:Uncharacterized protein n=1 Tax=Chionoecetes opilio TaxID=41210 RepID=A0A8J5CU38_CHIOP|nr:hypothetical protein GWK47_048465 [Chionoecetes opilio]
MGNSCGTDSQYRPEARVDICGVGDSGPEGSGPFWTLRVFDPKAASHRELSLEAATTGNELEKTRAMAIWILQVDHGTFTPLSSPHLGGMAPKARSFYSRLADLMSVKKHQPRSSVAAWMRCPPLLLPFSGLPSCVSGYEILHSL